MTLKLHTSRRVYVLKDGAEVPTEVRASITSDLSQRPVDPSAGRAQSASPITGLDVDAREIIEVDKVTRIGDIVLLHRAPHGMVGGFQIDELERIEEA